MKAWRSALLGLTMVGAMMASAQTPVPVGTIFPYTGAGSEWGPVLRNTVELCVAQVNEAATAVFGAPIMAAIFEDDATAPVVGVDRARKLVEIDGVPILIGTWSSGVTVAVAEAVTMPAQVLHIVPIATSPLIAILPADNADLLFRTIGSDALQGVVAAQLARGELAAGHSFETASVLFVNNAYGQGLAEQFRRSFEARGGRVLAMVPVPEEPQPTYAAQLERALAGGPEVLIPVLYPGHAVVALAEARDLFGYLSFQYLDALRSLDVLQVLGEAVVGQLGTVQGADGGRPGFRQFAADYQSRFGEPPPLAFMDTTYDACAVAGLAIAGVVAAGLEPTPLNLRDQLRAVAGPPGEIVSVGEFAKAFELLAAGLEVDFSGAAGEVDFNELGEVATAIEIWRFIDDGFETVMLRRAEEIPSK
ncbi:MAG: ABC transporter substrate-binding protein [Truepera sp.]|nr:ABC transporter substrate-binding protein [Truepera sp.]